MSKNIIQKIAAKAGKMYEVKPPEDDSKFKVKLKKPYEVGKGAQQALADRNQPSGAHKNPKFPKVRQKKWSSDD